MRNNRPLKFTDCLKLRQIVKGLVTFSLAVISISGTCGEYTNEELLRSFNPQFKVQTRMPNSYAPNVEVQVRPERDKSWLEYVFVEDQSGVLVGMRDTLKSWNETEEYAKNWNLDSTGIYDIKDQEDRTKYVNRYILKYLDKRVSGEVKNAEKGSALARVGEVQQTLKPQTDVAISDNFRLKFKARVLQGKAFVYVDNPYLDNMATVSLAGKVSMEFGKNFKKEGIHAKTIINVNDANWQTYLDKILTGNTSARVTSTRPISSGDSETRFELLFNQPF